MDQYVEKMEIISAPGLITGCGNEVASALWRCTIYASEILMRTISSEGIRPDLTSFEVHHGFGHIGPDLAEKASAIIAERGHRLRKTSTIE